jgi:hypothetical protein
MKANQLLVVGFFIIFCISLGLFWANFLDLIKFSGTLIGYIIFAVVIKILNIEPDNILFEIKNKIRLSLKRNNSKRLFDLNQLKPFIFF